MSDNEANKKGMKLISGALVHSVLAASIGSGFQHGYHAGVLNAPQDIITDWMGQQMAAGIVAKTNVCSLTISIICIGGIIGGALTSVLADKFGRRMTLIGNNAIAMLANVIMGSSMYANLPWMMIAGRFLIGVNSGLNSGVAPMYLSEISSVRIRGAVGSMYQLVITISILVALGVSNDNVLGTETLWPVLLYLAIIPAIYQVIAMYLSPESPKYLLDHNNEEQALKACKKLYGSSNCNGNLKEIKKEIQESKETPPVTMKDFFHTRKYRKPLIILCVLMAAQQLSGINAVIFYSTEIFKSAGLSKGASKLASIGVGIVNVLVTVVSIFLVEMLGRKPLLIIGFGGMAIDVILLLTTMDLVTTHVVVSYLDIALVYIFITLFALGAGSIPWILGSEMFATNARALGISIAVPVNWLFNFIISMSFLPLQHSIGPLVLLLFISSNAAATFYFLMAVHETKNKPIEEITAYFDERQPKIRIEQQMESSKQNGQGPI